MKVVVEHLGGVQFEVRARQHRIACDQPTENGVEVPVALSEEHCRGIEQAVYITA